MLYTLFKLAATHLMFLRQRLGTYSPEHCQCRDTSTTDIPLVEGVALENNLWQWEGIGLSIGAIPTKI